MIKIFIIILIILFIIFHIPNKVRFIGLMEWIMRTFQTISPYNSWTQTKRPQISSIQVRITFPQSLILGSLIFFSPCLLIIKNFIDLFLASFCSSSFLIIENLINHLEITLNQIKFSNFSEFNIIFNSKKTFMFRMITDKY